MRKIVDGVTAKFLLVGAINTLFGTSIMFLSYNLLHLDYWISSALNYILASILSYFLNKNFTFQSRKKSGSEAVKFGINIALCYFIAYGVAKPAAHHLLSEFSLSVRDNGAMLVGMGLFVVLNYLGQRYVVFRKQ